MSHCTECRESVAASAERCPHCGYDASARYRGYATRSLIIGTVLTITVIGAVIGIPCIAWGVYCLVKAQSATVSD